MKMHYSNNQFGLVACKSSGAKMQSKGVITGFKHKDFMTRFPLEDMCQRCLKIALADYKLHYGKDYTFKNNPYIETGTKV